MERLSDEDKQFKEVQKKLRNVEVELEVLKKSDRRLLQDRQVMYAFIDSNRGRYPVGMMARALRISPRSYFNYKQGVYSLRAQKRELLERLIQQVYASAKGRYGAPRIAAEIKAGGYSVSGNTVAKYMTRIGLRSKLCCRYKGSYSYKPHSLRICPNHLDRQFEVDTSGKVWVSDITYIATKDGFIYLTSVIDLFDRKVVGWCLSNNMTAKDTVVRAYNMAARNRKTTDGMIFHSVRGVQYASEEFRSEIKGKSCAEYVAPWQLLG